MLYFSIHSSAKTRCFQLLLQSKMHSIALALRQVICQFVYTSFLRYKSSVFPLLNFRIIKTWIHIGFQEQNYLLTLALKFYIESMINLGLLIGNRCLQLGGHRQEKWHRGQALDFQGSGCTIMAGPQSLLTDTRRLPKARSSWKSLSGLSLPWDTITITSVL